MQVAIGFDLTLLFTCLMRWSSFTQLLQFVGFLYKTFLLHSAHKIEQHLF